MAFTETWLTGDDSDNDVTIDGFGIPFRLDHDAEATGKGDGGMCIYVNKRYCSSVTVRERLCTPDVDRCRSAKSIYHMNSPRYS